MIEAGLLLGLFAALTFIVIIERMPGAIFNFIHSHPLLAELLSFVAFFVTITSVTDSLTGIFATFSGGIFFTIYILLRKNKTIQSFLKNIKSS